MATAAATKIRPLADRIVVKPLEETEQMRGGLYIPDTAKESPSRARSWRWARARRRTASESRPR